MPNVKVTRQVQNPNIDYDDTSVICVFNVPINTVIRQGSCWSMDQTQPGISPASLLVGLGTGIATGPQNFFPAYTPTAEVVVPPFSSNAVKLIGVYQGPTFTFTQNPLQYGFPLKYTGAGLVLASAEGGNAINTGSNLVISTTQYGAKQGSAALSAQVGVAGGLLINQTTTAAIVAPGSQTVNVSGIAGITTSTALTVDITSSGVQEVVTPTAVVSGVNANQTFTVGGTVTAAAVLTATIGGIAATYTTVSGDTATTAAANLIKAINATPGLVSGPAAIILPPTNAAGVITVRALTAGTAQNSTTTVATITNAGTTTFVAGGGTLASGTANTITAPFINAHASGAILQGIQNGAAATIIPGTANALQNYLVNCYLDIS